MKLKKALFQYIPLWGVRLYHRIRFLIPQERIHNQTCNNIVSSKKIELNKAVLKEKQIDTVKVIQYLVWQNPFIKKDYGKYQFKEESFNVEKNNEIIIEFNNYGCWTLEILYYHQGQVAFKEIKTINIEAPEYNIAYLAATLPVLLFLSYMWKISKKNSPTLVLLERILFDYNNLPKNVFPFSLASKTELNTQYKGFEHSAQRMVSYIGMLYKINPGAKFNLYLCDHQAYYVLPFIYANGIPEENFTVHLLSDGTASYDCFNLIFDIKKAEKRYSKMQKTWALSKQKARETGPQEWGSETFTHCGNPCVSKRARSKSLMKQFANRSAYSYVMTNDNKNFELILHDVNMLQGNQAILDKMTRRVHNINFEDCRKLLDNHRSELCKMIGLDGNPFESSYKRGKKICILLGRFPFSEDDYKYINKTMIYFGQDYDYYIKDHPWGFSDEKRKETLKKMGIPSLNPKIPTEIYMMLDPDVHIAGYLSSSFLSIGILNNPAEQILSVWENDDCRIETNSFNFIAKSVMNIERNAVMVYDEVSNEE